MSILGTILGRSKIKKGNREKFFSIITAEMDIEGRTDLRRTEKAGLVFNPVESQFFENLDTEIRDLLAVSADTTGARYEVMDDGHGTRWVILDDRDFEDLVTTLHLVGETITDHGFGDRIIASVFGFQYEGKKAYWIYYVKRGSFYPFVLSGEKTRDNAAEMRLSALMEEQKVPIEKDLEKWYALWGIPF
jgi:hypothetical protein